MWIDKQKTINLQLEMPVRLSTYRKGNAIPQLYEAFCIICICPVIVSMGAGGKVTGKRSTAVCKFLGDISYPIYITHYPLVYTYTAWVCNNNATMAEGIPYMILTFVGAVVLAYACLKLYDEPVRKWLTDRFLKGKKK